VSKVFKGVKKVIGKVTKALGPVGTIAAGLLLGPAIGGALASATAGTSIGSTLFGSALGTSGKAVGLFGAGGVASIKAGSIAGAIGATATKVGIGLAGNMLLGSLSGGKSERGVTGTASVSAASRTSEGVVSEEEKRRRAMAGAIGRQAQTRSLGGSPTLASAGLLG
jgi:hypothetical protein